MMLSSGPHRILEAYFPTPRTALSVNLHGDAIYERYANTRWRLVNSTVNWVANPHRLWASLGSSLWREKLLFDENDQRIQALKLKAITFGRGKSIQEILGYVCNLVNSLTNVPNEPIIHTEKRLDAEIEGLLEAAHAQGNPHIYLHMSDLITQRKLICRHKGLISTAILRECVEQNILPFGSVRQYRSTLANNEAHTWSVYRDFSTGHLWICDPRWRIADNVSQQVYVLAQTYSPVVLDCMLQRLDTQDIFVPIAEKLAEFAALPFTVELIQNAQKNMAICCRFKEGNRNLNAFMAAFQQQGIIVSHSDSALFIAMTQAVALLKLNVEKLLADFRRLSEISPEEASRQAVLQALSQQPLNKPIFFSVSSISITAAPPGTPFTFVDIDWSESLHENETIITPTLP